MLNVNLALFKCYWGDEIGITNHGKYASEEDWKNTFLLMWEGKLPSIFYDVRDNSFQTQSETFSVNYLDSSEYVISQIQRGHDEAEELLATLKRLINLSLEEKYKIIGKRLNFIIGEGANHD